MENPKPNILETTICEFLKEMNVYKAMLLEHFEAQETLLEKRIKSFGDFIREVRVKNLDIYEKNLDDYMNYMLQLNQELLTVEGQKIERIKLFESMLNEKVQKLKIQIKIILGEENE